MDLDRAVYNIPRSSRFAVLHDVYRGQCCENHENCASFQTAVGLVLEAFWQFARPIVVPVAFRSFCRGDCQLAGLELWRMSLIWIQGKWTRSAKNTPNPIGYNQLLQTPWTRYQTSVAHL